MHTPDAQFVLDTLPRTAACEPESKEKLQQVLHVKGTSIYVQN